MTDDRGRDAKREGTAASKEDAEAVAYYDNLGPWVPQALVRETLGVTDEELAEMRDSHRILGVEFGGQFYYPAWLFAGGNVVEGLGRVLDALSTGFSSAEAQVAWLAEPAFEGEPGTRWQALRRGHGEEVERWGTADAAAASGSSSMEGEGRAIPRVRAVPLSAISVPAESRDPGGEAEAGFGVSQPEAATPVGPSHGGGVSEPVDRPQPASRHVVRLADTDSILMSRAEARRVLTGASGFAEVDVDFTGVEVVGQGFADEVFRVWPSLNPGVHVNPINMIEAVEFMVRRALAG